MKYIVLEKYMEGSSELYYYDTYEETIEKVKELLKDNFIFSVEIKKS